MKLFRAIQGKEIEKENIGCHWTWKREVAENLFSVVYGDSSDDFNPDGDITIIEIEVTPEVIDFEATIESICEYPKEYEVVLKKNTQICEYNTGNRVDDWVEELDRNDVFGSIQHQRTYRRINIIEFNESIEMMSEIFGVEL